MKYNDLVLGSVLVVPGITQSINMDVKRICKGIQRTYVRFRSSSDLGLTTAGNQPSIFYT
jgi:hypothetical protein